MKILIADDNPSDRMTLKSVLVKLGYDVEPYADGNSVYKAIINANQPLISILDWMMPDIDGVDICSRITKSPPAHPVYTIILTSNSDKQEIAKALEMGANDFVPKPFDINELRARIQVGIRMNSAVQKQLESRARLQAHSDRIQNIAEDRAKQLVHADRMSTIGILSAGMAHEINNPVSFIAVNINTLEENTDVLQSVLNGEASNGQKRRAKIFLDTIPDILNEMKSGVARIREIVRGLKTYIHSNDSKEEEFSVNTCIEEALKLCHNRLKYNITVIKELGEVPLIMGAPRQIEQVLVNLIINAADAVESQGKQGSITLITRQSEKTVTIIVRDSGKGIDQDKIKNIFTPFFTTKEVGKGTGLGLSISKNIIDDHKGELIASNTDQGGAEFRILLPKNKKGVSYG